jgi:hypothetical protein
MKSEIRKDMDMNANLGGFAASLRKKDIWVMNVLPLSWNLKTEDHVYMAIV